MKPVEAMKIIRVKGSLRTKEVPEGKSQITTQNLKNILPFI